MGDPLRLRRFFALGLATTLLLLGAIAILNIAVNPLMLYRGGASVVPGIVHAEYGDYMRLAKPHAISDLDPTGIVLGNSRPLYGFDPTDPLFGPRGYNASIAGGGINVARDMLWHTLAVASPDTILLVLDPMTSLTGEGGPARAPVPGQRLEDFVTLAAAADGGGDPILHWLERQGLAISALQAGLSIDAVTRALGGSTGGGDYRRDGQRVADYGDAEVARTGQRTMFAGFLDRQRRSSAGRPQAGDVPADPDLLDTIEEIVRHAYEADADRRVIVLFDPVHAAIYWSGEGHGLFDRVTALIAAIADGVGQASAGRAEVWDCAGYSVPMTEPIPPAASRTHDMRWWWDGGHYTAATGAAMLDDVAGRTDGGVCDRVDPGHLPDFVARRSAELPQILAAGEEAAD